MAAAAFSIRRFAASKRGEQAAVGRRPLGIKDLPPLEAPRFRWWGDELASAVAAAAAAPSPRRSPKAKPPKKKRSISDLFAAAPPLPVPPSDESGGDEQTEVEDDEALLAIVKRAKEEKKRRRILQEEGEEEVEEEAAAAASADGCGGREAEGNFETTKEAPENPNLPDALDTQPPQKPEASKHLRKEMENISRRRKQGKIKNSKKKKADKVKRMDNNKADKVGKPRDLEKHLPRQSILKCIERTSVKMVKEKHVNSKGKEVIELSRKSVKRVKFSEADDILGSEMQGCEVPKRRSLSKLFSDAMASSSSSSYSSMSTEGDKCITAESSSSHMAEEAFIKTKEANLKSNHEDVPTQGDKCVTAESSSSLMPKEAFTQTKEANRSSNYEDSPTEGDKFITAESCSSNMPKEAFTKTKVANLNSNHEDSPTEGDKCIAPESISSHMLKEAFITKTKEANLSSNREDPPEPSNTELPSRLIDLNTLPESSDLNYTHDSNSEVPYLAHARKETLNSDVQLFDGRENRRNVSFDSHRMASQLPAIRVRNTRLEGTLFQGQPVKVSGVDIVGPPLSARELGETLLDRSNVSVKDAMTMNTSPCALPDHTFHDSFQQHQSGFHTNLSCGGSQLSTSGKFPSLPPRELNVQHDCSPSMGQTLRLMGKDLAVCTARGETSGETRHKHTGTSTNDYQNTNAVLELPRQGQPFLSLQARSFPNVTVNSTSTIHASTYHSSTSQAHFGYRTPHDFNQPIPAANLFSGDRLPYENRFVNFSNSQPSQPFLLGCPPLANQGSAALRQNSPPPWRYYSDPINRTEPPTAPFWPTTRQHGTPSSVFHGSLPQHNIMHSASSSARPLNSVSSTFSHPARVVQQAPVSIRDAALSSKSSENRTGKAVPGNSNASSSGHYVQKRSGPVKLTPGAKHILVPSDSTEDGGSVPVYSCVSFGSRNGNAAASQNKRA